MSIEQRALGKKQIQAVQDLADYFHVPDFQRSSELLSVFIAKLKTQPDVVLITMIMELSLVPIGMMVKQISAFYF